MKKRYIIGLAILLTLLIPTAFVTAVSRKVALRPSDPLAFDRGMEAYRAEDWHTAIAYFEAVPENDPRFAKAMRWIGWEIYAEELDDPKKGLPYVSRAMLSAPGDGNVWEDFTRTYGSAFGLTD